MSTTEYSLAERADQAEKQIQILQKIAETLQSDQKQNASFKQDILNELQNLKKTMKKEKQEVDTLYLKYTQSETENATLKKEIQKLNYRINHLIMAKFEADDKTPPAQ